MSIEDEIYLNYSINEEKLCSYGFVVEDGKLVYTKRMLQDSKIQELIDGSYKSI